MFFLSFPIEILSPDCPLGPVPPEKDFPFPPKDLFPPFPLKAFFPQIFSLSSLRSFPPFRCSKNPPFPPSFPDLTEERQKIWGKKANRERGEKILGRKSEKLSGGERPWEGKGGKDLNRERGGKDLREEREKIWGKKANRERGEKILGRKSEKLSGGERPWEGKGGKDLNRERVGKILGRKGGGKILGRNSLRSSPPFPP